MRRWQMGTMGPPLAEGTLFAGRYRIERCLAVGGMGAVYEASHTETGRRCALKALLPAYAESEALIARFKAEARLLAQVESEHIVEVLDAGVDDATKMPFLVMELLRGEEMGARLTRTGRLPPAEVLAVLEQTARALEATHGAGIVHRDLKPENLFCVQRPDGSRRIKVLDFGIATWAAGARAHTTTVLGTPLFMAPEQFVAGAPVTPQTDVYALALIAYTLLVGKDYWADDLAEAGSVFAFAARAAEGPVEAPSVRAARSGVSMPAAFDAWFEEATRRVAEGRFGSAAEAVAELRRAFGLASVPLEGELTPPPPRASVPPARAGAEARAPAFRQPVSTSVAPLSSDTSAEGEPGEGHFGLPPEVLRPLFGRLSRSAPLVSALGVLGAIALLGASLSFEQAAIPLGRGLAARAAAAAARIELPEPPAPSAAAPSMPSAPEPPAEPEESGKPGEPEATSSRSERPRRPVHRMPLKPVYTRD